MIGSGACVNCIRKYSAARKEARRWRRAYRRLVYAAAERGTLLSQARCWYPALSEAEYEKIEKAFGRFYLIRKIRKERLLRELSPSDLRALGLTPPLG